MTNSLSGPPNTHLAQRGRSLPAPDLFGGLVRGANRRSASARSRVGEFSRSEIKRRGWTEQRRARQSELIGCWQTWRPSTGSRTQAGRARSAASALEHGLRSRTCRQRLRGVPRPAAPQGSDHLHRLRPLARFPDLEGSAACVASRERHTMLTSHASLPPTPALRETDNIVTRPGPSLQYRAPGGRSIVAGIAPVRSQAKEEGRC
jgi:hypothetical protein